VLSIRKVRVDFQCAQFRKLLVEFLPNDGSLPLQVPDGRVRWTPRLLAICAILMPMLGSASLADRFNSARETVTAMYPTRKRVGHTYKGFVEALIRLGPGILQTLAEHLRSLMPVVFKSLWQIDGRLVFAVDGSRIECPRTLANEQLGRAGRKKAGPQFMLTTLFHVATGLPWAWRRGPGKTSERTHLREMLSLLPAGSWLLADAGFTGFALLQQLQEKQVNFIIRCGRNTTLLKNLGYRVREHPGVVYLWPEKQQRHRQGPMVLRLVRFHDGRCEVCLLVSELDGRKLPVKQVKEMYRKRWGVEVFYRSLKQTMSRGRVQSDSPEAGAAELDWSMMSIWLAGVVMLQQMRSVNRPAEDWSLAGALRVMRDAIKERRQKRCSMRWLADQLRGALKDQYQRRGKKASRDYPRKKYEPPAGAPKIRTATPSEVKLAQQLRSVRWAA
jgi:hypothetical protein